jgi:hypothetical protein
MRNIDNDKRFTEVSTPGTPDDQSGLKPSKVEHKKTKKFKTTVGKIGENVKAKNYNSFKDFLEDIEKNFQK